MAIKFLKDQDYPNSLRDDVLRRMAKSASSNRSDIPKKRLNPQIAEPQRDDLEALLEWGRKFIQHD